MSEVVDKDAQGSAAPDAEASSSASPATEGQSGDEARVPSHRLREETEKRRAVEAQLQKVSGQGQQWQTYGQTVASENAALKAQLEQYHAAAYEQGDGEVPNRSEEYLNKMLGTDEEGKKAREILDTYHEMRSSESDAVGREEVQNIVQQAVNDVRGEQQANAIQVGRIQKWQHEGLVSPEQASAMRSQIQAYVNQYPEVSRNGQQMNDLCSRLLANAVENGDIKLEKTSRANPLQPSGAGGIPAAEKPDPYVKPTGAALDRVKSLSPERIQQLTERSVRNHAGVGSGR